LGLIHFYGPLGLEGDLEATSKQARIVIGHKRASSGKSSGQMPLGRVPGIDVAGLTLGGGVCLPPFDG
jgi:hypothetical protein